MAVDMALLTFLVRPEARALAAAWPAFVQRRKKGGSAGWARLAGVPTRAASTVGQQLVEVGLLPPDGRLDQDIERFLAAAAAKEVMPPRGRARPRER